MKNSALILLFPYMRPESAPGGVPAGVSLFDPGLSVEVEKLGWRPVNLPFAPETARRLASELEDYASEFSSRGGMQGAGFEIAESLAGGERAARVRSSEETGALARFSGQSSLEPIGEYGLENAQKVLLLSLQLEDLFQDIQDLAEGFTVGHESMAASMGISPGDAGSGGEDENFWKWADESGELEPYSADLPAGAAEEMFLDTWEHVLEAMHAFAPEAAFFFTHPGILEAIEERGISFSPPENPVLSVRGRLLEAEAPIGAVTGRPDPGPKVRLLTMVDDPFAKRQIS